MKSVKAFKCDHCTRCSTNAGSIGRHEKWCKKNPVNQHACFDCVFLSQERDDEGQKYFHCSKLSKDLYSYKAEKSKSYQGNPAIGGCERMPNECSSRIVTSIELDLSGLSQSDIDDTVKRYNEFMKSVTY